MIKILIVTHGPLAGALRESAAMFFGDQADDICTIGLFPTENPEDLKDKICSEIKNKDDGDGFLIFIDIFGGLPFNMAALAVEELKENHKIECFTGVNMPVLMEALTERESMTIEELTAYLEETSQGTVANLRKSLDI